MHIRNTVVGCGLALLLSACGGSSPGDGDASAAAGNPADTSPAIDDSASASMTRSTSTAHDPDALQAKDGTPIALLPFDINSVPLSEQRLGPLPVITLPAGYGTANHPFQRSYARFPFRLGNGLHWVEGPAWSARIGIDRNGQPDKTYSALELQRNLESVLRQAGASQVFEGPLQRDYYYGPQLEDEIGGGFIDAVNMGAEVPTRVFVIRQAARTIWVQFSIDSQDAGLVVVEEQPFKASAHWSPDFPHLGLPAGYSERNPPVRRDFDMFPFWNGTAFEPVEGKTWEIGIGKPEHEYSVHEVRRNLQAMMAEAGGKRIFAGRIPAQAVQGVDETLRGNYLNAAGFVWDSYDAEIYRVDLADGRQVWIHARLEYMSAGWVVAERKGFQQTAALLPAEALRKQLDAQGHVAVQVNFASDKAQILPDSQPQIAQILALLKQDPALRLAVDGHTDDSGGSEHNQRLSEARAASVVAQLVAGGISAQRLQARGFGQSRPVADNSSDAGRASNRRVELVKR